MSRSVSPRFTRWTALLISSAALLCFVDVAEARLLIRECEQAQLLQNSGKPADRKRLARLQRACEKKTQEAARHAERDRARAEQEKARRIREAQQKAAADRKAREQRDQQKAQQASRQRAAEREAAQRRAAANPHQPPAVPYGTPAPAPFNAGAPAPVPAPPLHQAPSFDGKPKKKRWSDELPAVEAVLESMTGTGAADTSARQMAALTALEDYVNAREQQIGRRDPKARLRLAEYRRMRGTLGAASPTAPTQAATYTESIQFREDALDLFISKGSMKAYRRTPEYRDLEDEQASPTAAPSTP